MAAGGFKFEDDLLKHYVRVKGWLPLCLERKRRLQARNTKYRRQLRYFTFCAVNAVDVLMLDLAGVIARSPTGRFDTVYFFDRSAELVAQTQQRIPGSIGFAGNFVETVLTPIVGSDPLAAPTRQRDTAAVRRRQVLEATRRDFEASFPFDVLNLDLQDMTFKAKDRVPGDVINSLRKMCEWQRQPLRSASGSPELLDGFTLLFTTRVGPAELREDYATMLLDSLALNVAADGSLADCLRQRNGLEVAQLRQQDFRTFFELGVPKVIANVLMEEDWHVEPNPGVLAFRFTRAGHSPYEIVHFAMNAGRQSPPRDQRPPGIPAESAKTAYKAFVRRLFETPAVYVTDTVVSGLDLKPSLEEIKDRRRLFYPDEMG